MDLSKLGVWFFTDAMAAPIAADTAKRIEDLGFSALWIPETVGRNPFVHAAWLLANTSSLIIATGIANIYHREPGVTLAAQNTLAEQSDNRFLLGLGVSHKPLVEGLRGLTYGPPVATMRDYLDKMAASPYTGPPPKDKPPTVIAALGPKMLELSSEKCDGAQKVIFETDPTKARDIARKTAQTYQRLPNYRNNWLRMGLGEADIDGDGSDTFIDATFAWGEIDAIKSRVQEHYDAGASHVCVQPIHPAGRIGDIDWRVLEALA